jgi:hypothetical protein
MKKGDVFETPDGATIEVFRAAKDGSWADIFVMQPHGAWWTKRQPLVDGKFKFDSSPVVQPEELT